MTVTRTLRSALLACVVVWLGAESPAWAESLRYALIVGSNAAPDGVQRLRYAEAEAEALRADFVRFCGFRFERTRLLKNPAAADVFRAAEDLRRQIDDDQRTRGSRPADTLFALYFTGHSKDGQPFLKTGPVTIAQVLAIFDGVPAAVRLGFFDTCNAGRIAADPLQPKGARAEPGLRVFDELPQTMGGTRGLLLFLSSGAEELSYEDNTLKGALFTHFFREALRRQTSEGPGVTLQEIYEYVATHTQRRAVDEGHLQSPRQFGRETYTANPGFLTFSFPQGRSAELVLSDPLQGDFRLVYSGGTYSEIIQKTPGVVSRALVFPGRATLVAAEAAPGSAPAELPVWLVSGGRVTVTGLLAPRPRGSLAAKSVALQTVLAGHGVSVHRTEPHDYVHVGLGYGFGATSAFGETAAPRHDIALRARLDHGRLVFEGSLGYGIDRGRYPEWGYTAHALTAGVRLGAGFDFPLARLSDSIRVGPQVGLDIGRVWLAYDDGLVRPSWSWRPALYGSVVVPLGTRLLLATALGAGGLWSPGNGMGSAAALRPWAGLRLDLLFRAH